MKYCWRCIYPETKPNLWFDDTGLCSACFAYGQRATIDWKQREQEFRDKFPVDTRVVVACSGGKDSHYIIIKCLEYGLKPLAVTATTDHLSDIGRRNLDNIANLCDHIEVTPNKALRRKMAKYALQTVGDISWCEHVLIWSIPSRVAAQHGIQYVIYGENPQNEYGAGPKESQQQAAMSNGWEQEFGGLLGLRVGDMEEHFEGENFYHYRPHGASERIFLGHYFPWDGAENAKIAEWHGFERYHSWVEGSACDYENLDNYQTGIHDYFRYIKYGYGRATDILCNQIRRGQITRDKAILVASGRDGKVPVNYLGKNLNDILKNIDMTGDEFVECVHKFTNRELFDLRGTWPLPKFEVT